MISNRRPSSRYKKFGHDSPNEGASTTFKSQIFSHNWEAGSLGSLSSWPAALRSKINDILDSAEPMLVVAGDEMILVFNEAMSNMIGGRWREALGQSLKVLWRPIWPEMGPILKRAYRGELFLCQNLPVKTWHSNFEETAYYNCAFVPVRDSQQKILGTCCIANPTTASASDIKGINEQRDRLFTMLKDSPSFVLAMEGPEHRITFVNESFEIIARRKIVPGMLAREIIPEAERQGVLEIYDRVLRTGVSTHLVDHKFEIIDSKGRPIKETVNVIYEPIYGDGEKPIGVFVQGQSETAEVVAKHNLDTMRSELIHTHRVNSLVPLSSAIAHELNQPLATIANYAAMAEILLETEGGKANIQECLQGISKAAVRAGDVIRSLRDLIRKGQPRRDVFALKPIIADAIKLITVGELRSDVIAVDVSSSLWACGDPTQISQVMINLLRNACESNNAPTDVAISVQARRKGDMIEVKVRDFGPGISKDRLKNVFAPFQTSKEGGLGLGLSICRTIVEAHAGEIQVESNSDGKGVAFRFTLPRAPSSGHHACG